MPDPMSGERVRLFCSMVEDGPARHVHVVTPLVQRAERLVKSEVKNRRYPEVIHGFFDVVFFESLSR